MPEFRNVQVFQKYSPGFMITPSGGVSLTSVAPIQFGSDGAEASVGAFVGVIAGVIVVSMLVSGVVVGRLTTTVSESRACTVCATAVERADWSREGDPHAAASHAIPINVLSNLYLRRPNIQIPFCSAGGSDGAALIIPVLKKAPDCNVGRSSVYGNSTRGLTHTAQSCPAEPFARTARANCTFFPPMLLKSTSIFRNVPSQVSVHSWSGLSKPASV